MMIKYEGGFINDQVDHMTSLKVQSVQKWCEQMNFIPPTQIPPTHQMLCLLLVARISMQVQLVLNLEVR